MTELPDEWGVVLAHQKGIWIDASSFDAMVETWKEALASDPHTPIRVDDLASGSVFYIQAQFIIGMHRESRESQERGADFNAAWRAFYETIKGFE